MKKIYSIAFVTIVLLSSGLLAQNQADIEVVNIVICTSIENRQPIGEDSVFTADVGKLYCFTKLISQADTSEISHVWFYKDDQVSKVDLTMKARTWRTWSSKTILSDWKGDWWVEVQDTEGNTISNISFKVE